MEFLWKLALIFALSKPLLLETTAPFKECWHSVPRVTSEAPCLCPGLWYPSPWTGSFLSCPHYRAQKLLPDFTWGNSDPTSGLLFIIIVVVIITCLTYGGHQGRWWWWWLDEGGPDMCSNHVSHFNWFQSHMRWCTLRNNKPWLG